MNGIWLEYLTALFATVSAFFWVLSARVNFPYGLDMDMELQDAAKKASRLNAIAASFAAVAAALPAVKTFGTLMRWIS